MFRSDRPSTLWFVIPIVAVLAIAAGLGVYFYSAGIHPYWFPFPFFPLIFFPVFFLVFFGFRWLGCWGWSGGWYDPAMGTLRERYAKGEITKEQLDQMTRDLAQP
jgi:uncharacterized membrane protein